MIERELEITTPEGEMKTFIFHPEHGGPHAVVLYLMDAPSIRPALKDMASRLASAGYYVMLPYLYYRGGPFREFGLSDEDMHARRELMATVTPRHELPSRASSSRPATTLRRKRSIEQRRARFRIPPCLFTYIGWMISSVCPSRASRVTSFPARLPAFPISSAFKLTPCPSLRSKLC